MILEKLDNYTYILKNVPTMYENFAGRETRYNAEGNRNFNVKIDDPNIAQTLINDGFYLKKMDKLDEDSPDVWQMKISFKYTPTSNNEIDPEHDVKIKVINNGQSAELTRHNIHSLDKMIIKSATVKFHPYHWDKKDPSKCSAWLDSAKFRVQSDYYDEPDEDEMTIPQRIEKDLRELKALFNSEGLKNGDIDSAFDILFIAAGLMDDDIPF